MTGLARMYGLACASGALVFVALVAYAELDRAVRGWTRRRRALRRGGYVDVRGLRAKATEDSSRS